MPRAGVTKMRVRMRMVADKTGIKVVVFLEVGTVMSCQTRSLSLNLARQF